MKNFKNISKESSRLIKNNTDIDFFRENVGKPRFDTSGHHTLTRFNLRHQIFALWAISHLPIDWCSREIINVNALEIGCGGGRNIANLLPFIKNITAIDHSVMSVEYSKEYNIDAIYSNRVTIKEGNVQKLEFENNSFNMATAFETIYYWPNLSEAFNEVYRCLKNNGIFMVANETDIKDPKVEDKYDNLTIYTENEITTLLLTTGFKEIKCHRHEEKNWIVIIAKK